MNRTISVPESPLNPSVSLWLAFTLLFAGCQKAELEKTEPTATAVSTTGVPGNDAALKNEQAGMIRLTAISAQSCGVNFQHVSGFSDQHPFPAANGSGVAVLDFDNDLWPDLLFATSCPIPVPAAGDYLTRMFRNKRGEWQFDDTTKQAGLGFDGFGAGLAVGDFDNDGFSDFYLSCYGENHLYHNHGDGTFSRFQSAELPNDDGFAASCLFADFDNDGLLDIYVCNYGIWSPETNKWCGNQRSERRAFCDPREIDPACDVIYRNCGDGRFENKTLDTTVGERKFRGQGAIAVHLNEDDFLDLYVGNDMHPNCLYLNRGNWQLDEDAQLNGAAFDRNGGSQASMGIATGDPDGNGKFDVLVTNYANEHNTLYRNLQDGVFMDESASFGVLREGMPFIGWGTAFVDLNLDGWEDLIVINGHVDKQPSSDQNTTYEQPTLIYQNDRGRFEFCTDGIQDESLSLGSSRGLAFGDFDGDGDDDVVLTNQDDFPGLLRNDTKHSMNSSHLLFKGRSSNRDCIGLRYSGVSGSPSATRGVVGGGSYLSSNSFVQCFSIDHSQGAALSVQWPLDGQRRQTKLGSAEYQIIVEPEAESGRDRPTSFDLPR